MPSSNYVVRPLQLRELNELHELYLRFTQELDDPLLCLRANPKMVAWQLRMVRQQLLAENRYLCFVAIHEERIVGYAAALVESQSSVFETSMYGELSELYVLEEHRRRGVGRRLVERLLEAFEGAGVEHVALSASGDSSRLFCEALGFQAVSVNYRRSASG
ncbi:MAG: GNAT family N-acetyltransferase [Myxococcota bacterium]|jgi:GNAT superfamily N-acetyltransferase|nr:GNAT family N-acetyltransferase [Myxococcota bacterium]